MKYGKPFGKSALLLAAMSALASNAALAVQGREGHGGTSVNVDGRPVLRDLIDKTVCDWATGPQFGATLTYFPKVLRSIDDVHWYFGRKYREEMARVRVCMTEADLIQVPVDDEDVVTVGQNLEGQQVAVRLGNDVYVDMKKLRAMDGRNQGFLFTHELMHGFIPLNMEMRNTKVRSMVATISANEQSPIGAERFATAIEGNRLNMIPSSAILDGARKQLEFLENPAISNDEKMISQYLFEKKDSDSYTKLRNYFPQAVSRLGNLGLEVSDAVAKSDIKRLQAFFAFGLPVEYVVGGNGKTGFVDQAIRESSKEFLLFLIQKAPEVIENEDTGMQALSSAVEQERFDILKTLVSHPKMNRSSVHELFCANLGSGDGYGINSKVTPMLMELPWLDLNQECGESTTPLMITIKDSTADNSRYDWEPALNLEKLIANPRVKINEGPVRDDLAGAKGQDVKVNPFARYVTYLYGKYLLSGDDREEMVRVLKAFLARKDFNPNANAGLISEGAVDRGLQTWPTDAFIDNPLLAAVSVSCLRHSPAQGNNEMYEPLQLLVQDSRLSKDLISFFRGYLEKRMKSISGNRYQRNYWAKVYGPTLQILKQAEKARKSK